ncbi:hypothetical protein A6R68_01919 [Neotoma lepida]|uniref:Uncharacterized protein n=1 Tax=Neotoma lepida TaxID=56216 RepID=A0A1A6GVW3_NEOLE|nr:hypothetical protein A6R68_01919 [Neotoma lepida]
MSGVQSKSARLLKEPKEKPVVDADREVAASVDLKYNDVSAAMMKKFNALMEMQDMMFVEMRESLKNDLKEMLVKGTPPEVKSSEVEGEEQEGKDSASEWPKPGEKVEEESSGTDEDTENLTVKSEEKSKLSRKQDRKQLNSNLGVKPSLERMGEALHRVDDGCRESSGYLERQEALRLEEEEETLEVDVEGISEGEASEMGEEKGSELEAVSYTHLDVYKRQEEEEEEEGEQSEVAKEETGGSTFQGLTVVEEHGAEKITRTGEETDFPD